MPGVSSSSPRPQAPFLIAATEQILTWVFPSNCLSCGQVRRGLFGDGVCSSCWNALPRLDPAGACERCALPSYAPTCRRCLLSPPPFSRTFACGLYEGSLKSLLHAYKFRHFDHLSECFSELLAPLIQPLRDPGFQAVVAIPSTPGRNRERGFDPAALIARELARRIRVPYRAWLRRTRETEPQSRLPRDRRLSNVENVFACRRLPAISILLVDDIMTTGATASSAARALRAAGAASVSLAVLARTPELAENAHLEAL